MKRHYHLLILVGLCSSANFTLASDKISNETIYGSGIDEDSEQDIEDSDFRSQDDVYLDSDGTQVSQREVVEDSQQHISNFSMISNPSTYWNNRYSAPMLRNFISDDMTTYEVEDMLADLSEANQQFLLEYPRQELNRSTAYYRNLVRDQMRTNSSVEIARKPESSTPTLSIDNKNSQIYENRFRLFGLSRGNHNLSIDKQDQDKPQVNNPKEKGKRSSHTSMLVPKLLGFLCYFFVRGLF